MTIFEQVIVTPQAARGTEISAAAFGMNLVVGYERFGTKPWEKFDEIQSSIGSKAIRFQGGSSAELLFDYANPPESIDSAFICDVYHHFEYPQQSLASLHRALRRNGEVFLIDFKRVPGVSSDWILNHVRAGQDVVTAEFAAAGFKKIEVIDLLKDNYALRFRKTSR